MGCVVDEGSRFRGFGVCCLEGGERPEGHRVVALGCNFYLMTDES